ncbi:MAG: hypothetical protein KC503_21605 [Myxococcales bacterium]|nr:hypothetical protein [Myxococcales bacterium]
MSTKLVARFAGAEDAAAKVEEARAQGVMMLPLGEQPQLAQYAPLTVVCVVGESVSELECELVQAIPGAGLVVRVPDLAPLEELAQGATPPATAPAVDVSVAPEEADHEDEDGGDEEAGQQRKSGRPSPGVLSWPIEKLQSEFGNLSQPDKIRLARYGKRPARMLIARTQDKMLHTFLLMNPKIGGDEVAVLIGAPNADPSMIKRVIGSPEWLRHTSVARALISNPKLTQQQVVKVMRSVPLDDLRRMARTGRVRASVKREIIKYLEARGMR